MRDAPAHALAATVVLLALGAARLPAFLPDGEPLLSEAPDDSWTVRSATLGPGGLAAAGCRDREACKGVLARPVRLPGPGTWMVRASLERVVAGDGSRVFLSTPSPAWFAGKGPLEVGRPGEATAVAAGLAAGPAEVGVVVRGAEVVRVGAVTVLPARPSLAHAAAWWGTWAAAGIGALVALARVRRAVGSWPVALLGAAVVVGVTAPRARLDAALLLVPGTTPEDLQGTLLEDPTPLVLLQKLGGHALGFALLGAAGAAMGVAPGVVLARLVSFAAATEAVQVLLPDRTGRLGDVILDVAGGLLGLGLAELIRRVAAPRAPRASEASRP